MFSLSEGLRPFGLTRYKGGGGTLSALEILQAKGAPFFLQDFIGRPDLTFQEAVGPTVSDEAGEAIGLVLSIDQIGDATLAETIAAQLQKASNPGGPYLSTTGWVAGFGIVNGTLTTSGGLLVMTRGSSDIGSGRFVLPVTGLVVGRMYQFTSGAIGGTATFQSLGITASADGTGVILSLFGEGTRYIVATATTMYLVLGASATTGQTATLASCSIKEVPGYHAVQSVNTSFRLTRQADGSAKADRLDDNMLQRLTSSTSMCMMAALLGASTPSATAAIIGGPVSTTRGYLARDAAGKLCAGVGSDGPSTIVGGDDIAGLKGVALLNFDASGNVDLEWMPKGGPLTSLYSAPINGAVAAGTALRLFATNPAGVASNFGGDSLYLAAAIQTTLTSAERLAIATEWNGNIPS